MSTRSSLLLLFCLTILSGLINESDGADYQPPVGIPGPSASWGSAQNPATDIPPAPGIVSAAYDAFFNRYGIDIKKAIDGAVRPQGSA